MSIKRSLRPAPKHLNPTGFEAAKKEAYPRKT